ncbi:MAG: hypothetical protein ACI8ZB_002772 [Desulforhopalus sp.]|jgi:hypothetical protein
MRKIIALSLFIGLFVVGCGNEDKDTQSKQTESISAEKQMTTMQETVVNEIDEIKGKTEEVVETIKEESAPLIEQGVNAANESIETATEVIQNIVPQTAVKAPEALLVLDNKKGKITFSHKTHSEPLECITCHTTTEPGPFTLEKKAAHNLCKGCHKKNETGPTKCNGCHEKKPKVVVEGC